MKSSAVFMILVALSGCASTPVDREADTFFPKALRASEDFVAKWVNVQTPVPLEDGKITVCDTLSNKEFRAQLSPEIDRMWIALDEALQANDAWNSHGVFEEFLSDTPLQLLTGWIFDDKIGTSRATSSDAMRKLLYEAEFCASVPAS